MNAEKIIHSVYGMLPEIYEPFLLLQCVDAEHKMTDNWTDVSIVMEMAACSGLWSFFARVARIQRHWNFGCERKTLVSEPQNKANLYLIWFVFGFA
ncbi:UNVERIFIED_CONTAM: hypothetical protein Sindi_0115200 [Sesamum indicum]